MELATITLATHEHWEHHGGDWWPIFPIFWIVLIVGIVWLVRRGCRRGYRARHSGENVLGERYAKGEISEQEYRERLGVLREGTR